MLVEALKRETNRTSSASLLSVHPLRRTAKMRTEKTKDTAGVLAFQGSKDFWRFKKDQVRFSSAEEDEASKNIYYINMIAQKARRATAFSIRYTVNWMPKATQRYTCTFLLQRRDSHTRLRDNNASGSPPFASAVDRMVNLNPRPSAHINLDGTDDEFEFEGPGEDFVEPTLSGSD